MGRIIKCVVGAIMMLFTGLYIANGDWFGWVTFIGGIAWLSNSLNTNNSDLEKKE